MQQLQNEIRKFRLTCPAELKEKHPELKYVDDDITDVIGGEDTQYKGGQCARDPRVSARCALHVRGWGRAPMAHMRRRRFP